MIKKIFEHSIDIPDYRAGDELLNEGLSKEDSYWKRIVYPDIWYDYNEDTKIFANKTVYSEEGKLIALSQEDSYKLQDLKKQDLHRRKYGVHVKNGDDIEWISPDYYFFLQWFEHKDLPDHEGRHGGMRKIQNTILQLWFHVMNNPEIVGLIIPKIKKCGITYLFVAAYLNQFLINKNWDIMMMSKDFTVGKTSLFTFFSYGYNNLPYILKPSGGVSETLSTMKSSKPKSIKRQLDSGNYMNSRAELTKTKSGAFDAPVVKLAWIDETPKLWKESKVSPKEAVTKSIEAVKKQQVINGKLLLTSYMPEQNDRGFQEFKEICQKSLLSTIKEGNLRTETGLILMPIYANESNDACFDKYGNCDEYKATQLRNIEFSSKVTADDIQSFKRQYPMNWGHIFDNTGSGSTFDNLRLNMQVSPIREDDKKGILPYKEGNLRWENAIYEEMGRPLGEFSKIYFDEVTPFEKEKGVKGSIRIYHDLTENPYTNALLNVPILGNVKKQNRYAPSSSNLFVATIDPTDYKLKSDVKEYSLNASHGGFIYDITLDNLAEKQLTNTLVYEYNYRHENPDKVFEDMIKIVLYYGCYVLIEANRGWMITDFKKHGLQNFLLLRQANGTIEPYSELGNYNGGNKLVGTDSAMIDVYCRSISRYIAEPRHEQIDWLSHLKSIDLITQLMDFDPMNTRKYDLAVSFGYWRVACENYVVWLTKNIAKEPITEIERDLAFKVLNKMLS